MLDLKKLLGKILTKSVIRDDNNNITIEGAKSYNTSNFGYKVIFVDVNPGNFPGRDTSSHSNYYNSMVKYICSKYPNKIGYIFKGTGHPDSLGFFEIFIYDTSNISNGLPQYSMGWICQWYASYYACGTNNYAWNWQRLH